MGFLGFNLVNFVNPVLFSGDVKMAQGNTLTLELDEHLIEAAQNYAEKNQTTVTDLIAKYLQFLTRHKVGVADLPILHRLSGILTQDVSEDAYHEHLAEKHEI
jgi:hypothetical protein